MTGESKPERFQEVEIKLKLDERTYNELAAFFPAEHESALQENYFFDTSDQTLLNHRWGLRIRKEATAYYLTAKGPTERASGVHIRPEYEDTLEQDKALKCLAGFQLSALPLKPAQELLKHFGDLFVRPIFSFSNLRQFFKFDNWTLELDRTLIKDQVFFELEVETTLETLAPCQQRLKELFNAHGWAYEPATESKMEKAIGIFLDA